MKLIAVDDNVGTLTTVQTYLEKISWIQLVGVYTSPVEALDVLFEQIVDIVLVDVQMDELSGLEFINIAKKQHTNNNPAFIIISSYDQYAINGYELDITDYLLKPFRFDRFLLALEKGRSARLSMNAAESDCIFVPNGTKNSSVYPSRIHYVQSCGHFTKMVSSENEPLVINQTIQYLNNVLQPYRFIQIHKQYLVNIQYIKEISSTTITLKDHSINLPIGRKYKPDVFRTLLSS
ncbi:MAG: LytTR family DNA-binding domain-containing protein [Cyclobacteriaceae bacterium]